MNIKKDIILQRKIVVDEEITKQWTEENKKAIEEQKYGFRYENEFLRTKVTQREKKRKTDVCPSSWWQITVHDPYLLKKIYDVIRDRAEELGFQRATQKQIKEGKYIKKTIKEDNHVCNFRKV